MEIFRFKKTTKNKKSPLNIPQEIRPRNSCQNQQEGEVYPHQIRPWRKEIHLPRCILDGILGDGVM